MPQIFPKALNPIARILIIGFPIIAGSTGIGLAAFFRSGYATGQGEDVPQPVAFSTPTTSGNSASTARTATRAWKRRTSPASRRPRRA